MGSTRERPVEINPRPKDPIRRSTRIKKKTWKDSRTKIRHSDHEASSLKPIDLEKRMAVFSEAKEKIKGSEEETWMLINELESSRLNSAEKKLLFDLFSCSTENEDQVTKMATGWINGESPGVSTMDWLVCVREMDKCERWTNISDEQVGIQLEYEVLTSLMNELVLELITSSRS